MSYMEHICDMKISGIGPGAMDFIDENMIVLFGESAGNGIEEYSVRISMPTFTRDIAAGDTLKFGEKEYIVTAVGTEAMETLRLLGHCTLRFDGSHEAVLPGSIHLDDEEMPEIVIGDTICFY